MCAQLHITKMSLWLDPRNAGRLCVGNLGAVPWRLIPHPVPVSICHRCGELITEELFVLDPERLASPCPACQDRANNIHRPEKRESFLRGQRDANSSRRWRTLLLPSSSQEDEEK